MRLWESYLYQKETQRYLPDFYLGFLQCSNAFEWKPGLSGQNVKTLQDIIFRFCYNLFNKTNIDMGEKVSVIAHISDLEM